MLPRWSRLAFAAILALGVAPPVARAACCEPRLAIEDGGGPVVVLRDAVGQQAAPVVELAPVALAPSRPAEPRVTVETGAPDRPRVARTAGWRLAPKTSPPG